ncbi:unnamed protein product [Paramecium sonneborni]|uniref:Peptidase M12A domain-containing protein n=1 Tax=Paramecium sonneborni TaxID=65129 RepID=A0A8S1PN46_9CILI|nr:unnamed protein product [Paramecium sonneborni]
MHLRNQFIQNLNTIHAGQKIYADRMPSSKNIKMAYWVWPDGILPYMIDESFLQDMRIQLEKAILEFQQQTPIRFLKIQDPSKYKHYLIYLQDPNKKGEGYVKKCGRQPEEVGKSIKHEVFINRTARYATYLHETMHILGFMHTQCRDDRDLYVIINPGYEEVNDYQKRPNFQMIGNYDKQSIMHYSIGNECKMQPRPEYAGQTFGYAEHLSSQDIQVIKLIYGHEKCSYSVYQAEEIIQLYCKCETCNLIVCIPCGLVCHKEKNHKTKMENQYTQDYKYKQLCCQCGMNNHQCNGQNQFLLK